MPISHVNALMTNIYIPLLSGCSVCFVDITEKDSYLIKSLKLVRPFCFFASLVLLEITNDFVSDTRIVRYKNISKRFFFENFSSVRQYYLRKLVSIDKCLRLFCIGGIISDHIFDSLVDLGLRIQEVFGCSETCGPHLWAKFNAEKRRLFNCHKNKKASILERGELALSEKHIFWISW